MGKHNSRDKTGRFTSSGAPISGDDGPGDTSAYEHVDAISGNVQGEHDEPVGTVYAHDFARGPVHRLIPHRRQVVIDAHSGQQLSDHITDVRAVDARSNFGVADHVVSVEDDGPGREFSDAAYPHYNGPDTMRGYRRTPGTDGYKVPAMGQSDREADWKGGR